MRKTIFTNNHFYHIYNRGVDKRKIFDNDRDRFRFLKTMQVLNNTEATYQDLRLVFNPIVDQSLALTREEKGKPWVRIHAFCLMPNHFHLLIEQIVDKGVTKFLHKISTSYTKYFNLKNNRTGRLFEGTFKAILIEKDEYLIHLSRYIHLNPVELIGPNWKEKGIKNWTRTKRFLSEYKWSSLPIYLGKKTWQTIEDLVSVEMILPFFKSPSSYKNFLFSFIAADLEKIKYLKIEA